jgi:hypothetical protein
MTYLDSPLEFEPPKFSCMSQIKKNVILILLSNLNNMFHQYTELGVVRSDKISINLVKSVFKGNSCEPGNVLLYEQLPFIYRLKF